ncbi:geranylgeranyltransferase type I beta subunit [Trypanosoma grayi]|uniref:geranylgeranyltransferase type I beta subunit n=1 Tax=Trypanosoma grayi TaxID=71804 RepID=UPI0004F436F4|nr:geranylgeranyltransferase type I beta subunit [Trypanosoma grayi]KEG14485.1 geranylgeranyltransferase type I beta subunit [Trypanosoma grayi]
MLHPVASELEDEVLQVLHDRLAHLSFFDSLRRRVPAVGTQEMHPQRLLLLYMVVVGSDMLGAEWLAGDGDCNADKKNLLAELQLCYSPGTGGFHPEPVLAYTTSATLTMTQCALHVLNTCGTLQKASSEWLCKDRVMSFVLSCQVGYDCSPLDVSYRGAFKAAPAIAEIDLRFSYSALITMALLCAPLPLSTIPSLQGVLENAVAFIQRCWNPHEGGFGAVPGAESHGGMTFCAVASLALAGAMSWLTRSRRHSLLRYCTARVAAGPGVEKFVGGVGAIPPPVGYQGRPQKDCDTCYAHWIGSTLGILHADAIALVDPLPIVRFINACTNCRKGGIAKCIDMSADVVHSCLGLSGLLQHIQPLNTPLLRPPHPVYGCSWVTARQTGLPNLVDPVTPTLSSFYDDS